MQQKMRKLNVSTAADNINGRLGCVLVDKGSKDYLGCGTLSGDQNVFSAVHEQGFYNFVNSRQQTDTPAFFGQRIDRSLNVLSGANRDGATLGIGPKPPTIINPCRLLVVHSPANPRQPYKMMVNALRRRFFQQLHRAVGRSGSKDPKIAYMKLRICLSSILAKFDLNPVSYQNGTRPGSQKSARVYPVLLVPLSNLRVPTRIGRIENRGNRFVHGQNAIGFINVDDKTHMAQKTLKYRVVVQNLHPIADIKSEMLVPTEGANRDTALPKRF
jgi:hypothetical protein